MDILYTALLAGLIFGVLDMFFMISYKAKSPRLKKEAMVSVFIQRFATGFVIPYITLPIHPSITGAVIAFIFSIPLAIFLKVRATLLGAVIGFIIGWLI